MQRQPIPIIKNTYIELLPIELRKLLAEKYYGPVEVILNNYVDRLYDISILEFITKPYLTFRMYLYLSDLDFMIRLWYNKKGFYPIIQSKAEERSGISLHHETIAIWTQDHILSLDNNISEIFMEKIKNLANDIESADDLSELYNMRY